MARKQPESEQPVELPPQVPSPERKMSLEPIKEEQGVGVTSYCYEPTRDINAACHDDYINGWIYTHECVTGPQLNWRNANREMFYGVVKATLEHLLIDMVDDIEQLDIIFEVNVKPKCRADAVYLISEWKDAVKTFHHNMHWVPVNENHHCDELQGVEHED